MTRYRPHFGAHFHDSRIRHPSDMQWVGFGGKTKEYRGLLYELGQGVPRKVPGWGIRRAIFDLAFGYVSGFPVRDILYFVFTRSLWPRKFGFAEVE